MKELFSIDRSAIPKSYQDAVSSLNELFTTFPGLQKMASNISNSIDNDYIYYGNYPQLSFSRDRYGDIYNPYNECEFMDIEKGLLDDIRSYPFIHFKKSLSPTTTICEHISSFPKTKYSIYRLIFLCQYLCNQYKYPIYDDLKKFIPIDFDDFNYNNDYRLEKCWRFNDSVANYLLLQYIYRKSIHESEIPLTDILDELNYSTNKQSTIKQISNNFSSKRAKLKEKFLVDYKDNLETKYYDKIIAWIGNDKDTLTWFDRLTKYCSDDQKKYTYQLLVEMIELGFSPSEIDKSKISDDISYFIEHSLTRSEYIGCLLNPSWSGLTLNHPIKWSSKFDFLIANGLFFGTHSYNPFISYEISSSFQNYLVFSKFKSDSASAQSFINGFIPKNIILSEQNDNFICMTQYILERMSNINLANSITLIATPFVKSKLYQKNFNHCIQTLADNASILSRYPLPELRLKYLLFMQDFNSPTNIWNQNITTTYIQYLIRHHIYLYFPLISKLFHILLSLIDLPQMPIPNVTGPILFDTTDLTPLSKYNQLYWIYDTLLYDEPLDKYEPHFLKERITYKKNITESDLRDTIEYVKKRIYHSYYHEIYQFSKTDFANSFREFEGYPLLDYIYEMDTLHSYTNV